VELRPHQTEGVNKMIFMEKAYRGGILADEMGLGKVNS
jgi:SNF2 family DNA or RNA helicase